MTNERDVKYMMECIELAEKAAKEDEVPVGAIVVCGDRIVGRGYNRRESDRCATHHAEILAIEEACATLGGWRLPNCTLYVTLEPCIMCSGAIVNARIDRVVFGAYDEKSGGFGSVTDVTKLGLNYKVTGEGGFLADECRRLLSEYFRVKRKIVKTTKCQDISANIIENNE